MRAPLQPGAAIDLLRTRVAGPGADRYLSPDQAEAEALLAADAPAEALRAIGVELV